MSNDITKLQSDLLITKQQNEILHLKHELEKLQAKKSSRLEDSLFSPALYQHYQSVAQMLSKSNVIPANYRNKPEDVFVAIAMGYQLGFPVEQALQDIAVINSKPCLWGDGLLALALSHPECEDIQEMPITKGDTIIGYSCTVKRKGHQPHTQSFTLQNAENAGLIRKGGVWTQYPSRMLQMRARSLAIRDKFADALRGIKTAEEQMDVVDENVIEGSATVVTGKSNVEKLKDILKAGESNVEIKVNQESSSDDVPLYQNKVGAMEDRQSSEKNPLPTGENGFVEGKNGMESQAESRDSSAEILDSTPISAESIAAIEEMMNIKSFDEARRKKAIAYFKAEKLEDLTAKQAKTFMAQLAKC